MPEKPNILAIIPARGGSKRIPNKNIRDFCGKPLIAYAIEQAKKSRLVHRVVVDTDSPKIAEIARAYGADVPFLRPKRLATHDAGINDALLWLLHRLKKEEGYEPTHSMLLQTTSPLREERDITACWERMQQADADTVLTVCETNPRFFHLDAEYNLLLVNPLPGGVFKTNTQDWPKGYILNGCFVYITKTSAFLREKTLYTKKTKAVVCDRWRSVDIDTPEDFVVAEYLYKHRKQIMGKIAKLA